MADELLAQVLEETRRTGTEVSLLRADLARMDGRVTAELASGSRRMRELADDDAELGRRVTALERATWKAIGAAGTIGAIAGGAAGTALSALLHH